jgi:uncharacterized protein YbjT (DUF2867 family)
MILVVGATGTTGSAVVRDLVARGARVRALTRTPAHADALRAAGVEPVVGDLADPASLGPAWDGVERAYVASPLVERLADLEANAYAAAERAGVYHVVKLGSLGQSSEAPARFSRAHAAAFDALHASSLRWTLLESAPFMQNLLTTPPGVTATPDARVARVDARDVAAVAARALSEEGHENCSYQLTGPEAMTDADVAGTLADVLGRDVPVAAVSDDELASRMRGHLPDWTVDGLVEVWELQRSGALAGVAPDVVALLGRPATPFRRFAEDHRDAFAAAIA